MDFITLQSADKALKDYYLDAVTAQLNDGISPFFTAIEKSAEYVSGKDVKATVIRNFSGSVMAGAEDSDLPKAYSNKYIDITSPLKNIYGTIAVSDKAIRASKDSSGAIVNLLNAEMDGLIKSAKQNFSRMLFGDGSGYLCDIETKTSNTLLKVSCVKEYFTGMLVDLYVITGNLAVDGAGVRIAAVDKDAGTITLETPVSDVLAKGKVYVHGSKGSEITGLGAIFGGSELYGYNKATDPYFRPYSLDCGGKLTESLLSEVLDYMEENFNSKINMILCSYKTRRMIADLINENRRVVNSIDVRTGYGTVTVNDIPVYAEKYCPEDVIYFINTEDFNMCQLCDWEWLEDEDGKILKQIAGKAAYNATLVKYAELICRKPCGQAMLTNFTPSA